MRADQSRAFGSEAGYGENSRQGPDSEQTRRLTHVMHLNIAWEVEFREGPRNAAKIPPLFDKSGLETYRADTSHFDISYSAVVGWGDAGGPTCRTPNENLETLRLYG